MKNVGSVGIHDLRHGAGTALRRLLGRSSSGIATPGRETDMGRFATVDLVSLNQPNDSGLLADDQCQRR